MPVNILQWRVEIGDFNSISEVTFFKMTSLRASCSYFFCNLGIHFVFIPLILFVCGEFQVNLDL